jgi:DNA-binding response OmpR family regulator
MGKILIVDDEPDTLVVTALFLKSHGFEVITASGAAEALALVEREQPDLVLTDFMMPGLSGVELCRRIRAGDRSTHVPIIMASAAAQPPSGGGELFDAFIAKPTYFDELLTAISRLLQEASHEPSRQEEQGP